MRRLIVVAAVVAVALVALGIAAIVQNAAVERIAEAAEKIRSKGYDLGPIATD